MNGDFSTAGDGIPDWWKLLNGLSVTGMVAGAVNTNSWAHGLTNWQIYQNPSVTITNNFSTLRDGVPDWWKLSQGDSLLDSNVSAALTSLIGWWKLDEGAGSNALDSSWNGLTGALNGGPLPQWTNGVSANALWFNGTSNDVEVSSTAILSPTNQLTLLAWVQIASNPHRHRD